MKKNLKINGIRNILNFTNLLPDDINKKREPFIPEIKPTLIPYNKIFWEKVFPYKKGINYKDLQLSNIGSYSIFYPNSGDEVAKIIRSYIPGETATITDANSNMGGAIFAFSNYFNKINGVEIIKMHCMILENNITIYKINDKVKIYCADYLDIADKLDQDVVFFDPPWGGKSYKDLKLMNMYLDSIPIHTIIKSLLTKTMVAIRVPFNYDFKKLFELTPTSYVHSIYRPDGKLSFYLVILKKKE